MLSGTQSWRDSPQAGSAVAQPDIIQGTTSRAPGWPSPLPTVALGCSSSSNWCCSHQHTALLLPARNSCPARFPVTHQLCGHGSFTVWCFPQPSLASPAPALEFAIWLQPGAQLHDPSSPLGLGCRLFFPCSFQHKKNSFFPTLLVDKKQVKNSCKFWGVFLLFCKRKRAGSWAFPQILLHEMDVLEKRKSTAGELTWRGCRAALWVGVCTSAGLSSATSFSASPHLHQQDIQAQPHQSILLALKHESVCTSSR